MTAVTRNDPLHSCISSVLSLPDNPRFTLFEIGGCTVENPHLLRSGAWIELHEVCDPLPFFLLQPFWAISFKHYIMLPRVLPYHVWQRVSSSGLGTKWTQTSTSKWFQSWPILLIYIKKIYINTKRLWDSIRETRNVEPARKPIAAQNESAKANEFNECFVCFWDWNCQRMLWCNKRSTMCGARIIIDWGSVTKLLKSGKQDRMEWLHSS